MSAPRAPLQILHGGRAFNGSYRVEGGRVHVESAYGSEAAALGSTGADPKAAAEKTLRELVERWSGARRTAAAASGFGRREIRLG